MPKTKPTLKISGEPKIEPRLQSLATLAKSGGIVKPLVLEMIDSLLLTQEMVIRLPNGHRVRQKDRWQALLLCELTLKNFPGTPSVHEKTLQPRIDHLKGQMVHGSQHNLVKPPASIEEIPGRFLAWLKYRKINPGEIKKIRALEKSAVEMQKPRKEIERVCKTDGQVGENPGENPSQAGEEPSLKSSLISESLTSFTESPTSFTPAAGGDPELMQTNKPLRKWVAASTLLGVVSIDEIDLNASYMAKSYVRDCLVLGVLKVLKDSPHGRYLSVGPYTKWWAEGGYKPILKQFQAAEKARLNQL